jgi:hypothetical protein
MRPAPATYEGTTDHSNRHRVLDATPIVKGAQC